MIYKKWNSKKWLLLLTVACVIATIAYIAICPQLDVSKFGVQLSNMESFNNAFARMKHDYSNSIIDRKSKPVVIYVYNDARINKFPYTVYHEGRTSNKCSSNCIYTQDSRLFPWADAVLVHHWVFKTDTPRLKRLRAKNKILPWIWFELESPVHTFGLSDIPNDMFQLTSTYQNDSDIWQPYCMIEPRKNDNATATKTLTNNINYAAGKTKMALIFMTHCVGYRQKLINKFKEYIKVDFVGPCSSENVIDCLRHSENCVQKQKQYKFFLSWENSYCDGYITEKFFERSLQMGLVPVILTKGYLSDITVAPPGSYINILDYPDIESLAKHLKYLDANDTAYNEYHAWRKNYDAPITDFHCSMCEKLWEKKVLNIKPGKSWNKNLANYWNGDKKCVSYDDTEMFQKYLK